MARKQPKGEGNGYEGGSGTAGAVEASVGDEAPLILGGDKGLTDEVLMVTDILALTCVLCRGCGILPVHLHHYPDDIYCWHCAGTGLDLLATPRSFHGLLAECARDRGFAGIAMWLEGVFDVEFAHQELYFAVSASTETRLKAGLR